MKLSLKKRGDYWHLLDETGKSWGWGGDRKLVCTALESWNASELIQQAKPSKRETSCSSRT